MKNLYDWCLCLAFLVIVVLLTLSYLKVKNSQTKENMNSKVSSAYSSSSWTNGTADNCRDFFATGPGADCDVATGLDRNTSYYDPNGKCQSVMYYCDGNEADFYDELTGEVCNSSKAYFKEQCDAPVKDLVPCTLDPSLGGAYPSDCNEIISEGKWKCEGKGRPSWWEQKYSNIGICVRKE